MNAQELRNANTNAAANEQMTINLDTMIIDGKLMQKQKKITKRIQSAAKVESAGRNKKVQENDECYTDYNDIIDELRHWGELGKLRGKNIICPCDWDVTVDSDVYRIRVDFSEDATTKKTDYVLDVIDKITTTTMQQSVWVDTELARTEMSTLLSDKLKCNFVAALIDKAQAWGIKSITASGYNPELDKGFKFQDVDYSKYDVCITNPPFSLYKEFLECIVGKIDFVILAPTADRVTPQKGGLCLQTRKMYLGFGRGLQMNFSNPCSANGYTKTKQVQCDWWTSWSEGQEYVNSRNHKTGIKYDLYANDYVICPNMTMKDGTHPIRATASEFPEDYNGWIFTDINTLSWLNTDEYEFYGTGFHGYFNRVNPAENPFAHKESNTMIDKPNGGRWYHGYVVRKKQN